mgnify:CR=1 FL=1|jgi:hypothetical protein|tara:strand:+ start:341 stop:535 length:195 start_codon:yes stop_codon:yes gene_type:complete
MSNKFYKFHFKNDEVDMSTSYDIELDTFSDATEFAYNKLDELNNKCSGYRIVGIYEILGYKKQQ